MSSSSSTSSTGSSGSSNSSNSSASVASGGRGVYLRRLVQTRFQTNVIDGFRFRVEAHDANLMPKAIFRYLRRQADADGNTVDEFDGVCSPPDLEEFGEGEPVAGAAPPFLRLDYVDVVFRSQSQADDAWKVIVEDVTALVETLNVMDNIVEAQDLKIGDPPAI